jgi:excisionase family DNA binding protein
MRQEYLKVGEAARALRLSEVHVRYLLRHKRLKGAHGGGRGRWRVPVEAIEQYLQGQAPPAVSGQK